MAFCSKCGSELQPGAKFCASCGNQIIDAPNESTRVQKFSGQIKKCPNCGSVLPSGVLKCPECGYEIRDSQASYAAMDFFSKIQNTYSIQQKVDIIKNYPIPNTKEDIMEFLNRAKAELQGNYNPENSDDILLYNAWVTHCNNLKSRVNSLTQSDKAEFEKLIYEIEIIEKKSSIEVDAFRIALTKCTNPMRKVELIKSYPIKPNSGNLMSLVDFIDSQIEFESRSFFNGAERAWFARLQEISNQTSLLDANMDARNKIDFAINSIKQRKRRRIIKSVVWIFLLPLLFSIWNCVYSCGF